MTLRDLIQLVSENPSYPLAFFTLAPFTAALALVMGRGEGHLAPWKFLYSVLAYLACVPGVFSIALTCYHFLFERISIYDANLFTQVLPVVSMVLTLVLIRKNVDFAAIPGFEKISSLMTTIAAVLVIMWLLDRTRIFVVSFMPIQVLLLILVGLLLVIRFGVKRIFA